jgi:hypothetical protein
MRKRRLPSRNRSGVALLGALALLALLSLLVAGAFATTTLARRGGALARSDASLTAAADDALGAVISEWHVLGLDTIPAGAALTLQIDQSPPAALAVEVTVTGLPRGIYWIVADVTSLNGDGGHRRASLVVRVPAGDPLPEAGLVARGDVALDGGVRFERDSAKNADCPAVASPDVIVGPGAHLRATAFAAGVTSEIRPAADDAATYRLSGAGWAELRALAATYALGDLALAGGVFDGVMLVEGRLSIEGPVSITGLVIARNGVDASRGVITVNGALQSYAAVDTSPAIRLGEGTIRFSPCAVVRALRSAAVPRPVRERGWGELF